MVNKAGVETRREDLCLAVCGVSWVFDPSERLHAPMVNPAGGQSRPEDLCLAVCEVSWVFDPAKRLHAPMVNKTGVQTRAERSLPSGLRGQLGLPSCQAP